MYTPMRMAAACHGARHTPARMTMQIFSILCQLELSLLCGFPSFKATCFAECCFLPLPCGNVESKMHVSAAKRGLARGWRITSQRKCLSTYGNSHVERPKVEKIGPVLSTEPAASVKHGEKRRHWSDEPVPSQSVPATQPLPGYVVQPANTNERRFAFASLLL